MSTETITLIAAIIAAGASIISLYINSRLTLVRERRQQLWQYDLEQIRKIEETAGRIAEVLGGYPSYEKLRALLPDLLFKFEEKMGRLLRYDDLNQAMRDFHNAACRVFDTLQHSEDARPDKQDLASAFEKLIKACDKVLKRKGV